MPQTGFCQQFKDGMDLLVTIFAKRRVTQTQTDLLHGFPMFGRIPAYGISARTKLKVHMSGPSVEEVWSKRKTNNRRLLQSLTEDRKSEEIFKVVGPSLSQAPKT